jgi:hypothetical protein
VLVCNESIQRIGNPTKRDLQRRGQVLHDERSLSNIEDMQLDCSSWMDETYRLVGQDLDAVKFDMKLDTDLSR